MTEAWLKEEESPYHEYSHLLNDRTIGCSREFCYAHATSVEHSACQKEADGIHDKNWLSMELLHCYEDVICVVINASTFVKWAWVKLGGNKQHCCQN